MFITALFIIDKMLKQPKCSSSDERRNKMWHIHMVGYYSPIKMNEVLILSATWMNIKENMLSKRSQS